MEAQVTAATPTARKHRPAPGGHPKRSFLKLPAEIDTGALLADYRSIPPEAWKVSHWEIHCSSAMVLLRGGKQGTEDDFSTRQVFNTALLSRLPYLSQLVSDDGPFGQPTYAFIFRMKPMGVAQPHVDDNPAWADPFRLHLPITTNSGSFLLSEGRARHFGVGEVWTFDNQAMHAVTNGDTVRAHLIIDVHPNPKLNALLGSAHFDPGVIDLSRWERTSLRPQPSFAPLRSVPLTMERKLRLGLNPDGFASEITGVRWIGKITRAPVQVGDIVYAVNKVDACEMTRTATEYLQLRHQPGETVNLGLLREEERITRPLTLYRNFIPTSARKALWKVMNRIQGRR